VQKYTKKGSVLPVNTISALFRIKHWVKNLLVFAPLFFAVAVFDSNLLIKSVLAFMAFCIVSSIVYIINDIIDVEQDRLHILKKTRPLASGRVSLHSAFVFIGVLVIIFAVILSFIPKVALILLTYVVLNIFYSLWFKHVAVLDVAFVSGFYIMRLLAGGVATGIYVSPWIILCVMFGALFVILGKRRAEFYRGSTRKVLNLYSNTALDLMLGIAASLAVISYSIWAIIGHELPNLVYSSIFVVFALFRLLNNIYIKPEEAESPELLVFKDKWILSSFVCWVLYVFVVFYTKV
jgi:decaprenyl-phosphate phosphoribosyltransferase